MTKEQIDGVRKINNFLNEEGKQGKLILRTADGVESDLTQVFKLMFQKEIHQEIIEVTIAHYREDWDDIKDLKSQFDKIEHTLKNIYPKSSVLEVKRYARN